jgi:hypothetical protein
MAVLDRAPPATPSEGDVGDNELLLQAVSRAADELNLSRTALARVLGKDRTTLTRAKGIDVPHRMSTRVPPTDSAQGEGSNKGSGKAATSAKRRGRPAKTAASTDTEKIGLT